MIYTVIWTPSGSDALADLWTNATLTDKAALRMQPIGLTENFGRDAHQKGT